MEHKFKRVFAFLLSMLMLFNSVPVNAFATEVHEHDHEAEVMAVAETDEHVHSLTFVDAKDASCTEDGNIAYYFCECGKYFFDQEAAAEIPAESIVIAAGHSWDEGVVTTEATETAEGVMTYTCSGCGETKTEAIPMLVHTHSLSLAESGEYWVCGCGAKFADEAGTTVYTEPVPQEEVCAHSNLTATEAVAATCETEGNTAY